MVVNDNVNLGEVRWVGESFSPTILPRETNTVQCPACSTQFDLNDTIVTWEDSLSPGHEQTKKKTTRALIRVELDSDEMLTYTCGVCGNEWYDVKPSYYPDPTVAVGGIYTPDPKKPVMVFNEGSDKPIGEAHWTFFDVES